MKLVPILLSILVICGVLRCPANPDVMYAFIPTDDGGRGYYVVGDASIIDIGVSGGGHTVTWQSFRDVVLCRQAWGQDVFTSKVLGNWQWDGNHPIKVLSFYFQ